MSMKMDIITTNSYLTKNERRKFAAFVDFTVYYIGDALWIAFVSV